MAEPSYAEVWAQQEQLKRNEQFALEQVQKARAVHASAESDLKEKGPNATTEQLDELNKKVLDSRTALEQKSAQFDEAQKAIVDLRWEHRMGYGEALENNVPPEKTLREKAQGVVDGVTNTAMAATVAVTTFGPAELPSMSAQPITSNPPIEKADLPDRLPNEERRQRGEAQSKAAKENEILDKAAENAHRAGTDPGGPKPEVTTVEAQGSATFGAQAFSSPAPAFPQRTATNDNTPPGPPTQGGAGAAPPPAANDNAAPLDAVATKQAVNARVAHDFGAPPPPLPPPPPPPEQVQENKMAR